MENRPVVGGSDFDEPASGLFLRVEESRFVPAVFIRKTAKRASPVGQQKFNAARRTQF
jgi:hypothetical protein